MRSISLPHSRQGDCALACEPFPQPRRQITDLPHGRLPLGVKRVVNLPAPVRRFAQPNAKIAQLILRFAEKLHHRFLATLLFHEGSRCRTGPFGEPARSTSLLLRAIICPRSLFGTTRGATCRNKLKLRRSDSP